MVEAPAGFRSSFLSSRLTPLLAISYQLAAISRFIDVLSQTLKPES
jgi:hypothetical protein